MCRAEAKVKQKINRQLYVNQKAMKTENYQNKTATYTKTTLLRLMTF